MYERQRYLIRKKLDDAGILNYGNVTWFVAGGALRAVFSNEKIKDLDIYFPYGKPDIDGFRKGWMELPDKEVKRLFNSDSAETWEKNGVNIQLIKKIYGTPKEIINQFDFTICMCAYDPINDKFVMHDNFLNHLAMKLVYYNPGKYPINSLYRMKKYMEKGYNVPAVEIIKIALTINNLKMENYRDLRDQLEGIDTVLLADITDALMEKKDIKYEFTEALEFMNKILDEKFNKINEEEKG